MAQRHMRPSVGVLQRSFAAEVATVPYCASRAFHLAPRRLDEQPSDAAPSAPTPDSRKARSAIALRQLTSLGNRRGGLARGRFPGAQMARGTPQSGQVNELGFLPEDGEPGKGPAAKSSTPQFVRRTPTGRPAPPRGQMIRAPAQLRITRDTSDGPPRGGLNFRGRGRGRGARARGGGPGNRGDVGPKGRQRDKDDSDSTPIIRKVSETDPSATLSDGMLHHLLRLQRKEWDRVPYEPKYAPGSFAANELIHTGRELFRGESPPVKIWGPLEKRIGVVGMFGAEAHLQIRRVGDGDAEPYGQEILEVEEMQDVGGSENTKKEAAVQ